MDQLVKFNVTDAALKKLKTKYAEVPDVSSKKGYEIARLAIGEIRTIRTGLGDCKKKLKADAIAFNKKVDTEYNRVLGVLTDIEEPLKKAKDAEDAKKEALKEEKRQKEEKRKFAINQKINEIREIAFSFTDETSEAIREQIDAVKEIQITKDVYEEFVTAAQMAVIDVKTRLEALLENVIKREEADAERKLEDERLADERKKLDEEKALADAERDRIAIIKTQIDHIQALPFGYDGDDSSTIELGIQSLEAMELTEDEFEEFTAEAQNIKKVTLVKLQTLKSQVTEKEGLQKKQEELDEREKKADEEKEAAAKKVRLAEEKEAQDKKDKKALKENKKLTAEKYDATLTAMSQFKDMNQMLDAIIAGEIENLTYEA